MFVGSVGAGTAAAKGTEKIVIDDQQAFPVDKSYPVPADFAVALKRVEWDDAEGTIALPVKDSDNVDGVSEDDTYWYENKTDDKGDPAPAFVVGLHSRDVGTGEPDSLSSLIGVKPLRPGTYTTKPATVVPVWNKPPAWQQALGAVKEEFPEAGDEIQVTATLWYGPAEFPPAGPKEGDFATAPNADEIEEGPLYRNEKRKAGLVKSRATVDF